MAVHARSLPQLPVSPPVSFSVQKIMVKGFPPALQADVGIWPENNVPLEDIPAVLEPHMGVEGVVQHHIVDYAPVDALPVLDTAPKAQIPPNQVIRGTVVQVDVPSVGTFEHIVPDDYGRTDRLCGQSICYAAFRAAARLCRVLSEHC